MRENSSPVSRRQLLQTIGGTAAVAGFGGLASARPDDIVEVNIGFDHDNGRQAAVASANSVVREYDRLDAVTIRVPKRALKGLQQRPDVRYVEENGQMHAIDYLPWGVDRVDADVAHGAGFTGTGADIAILDTGIDATHPDLEANLGSGAWAVACSGSCSTGWDDDNGHGTHCAGIADAVDNSGGVIGVSTNATLHAVKVLNSRGSGSYSDIAAGIEYVANQGWDVASLSLGGSKSAVIEDAVEYAYGQGVLLVVAAGNSGPCSYCVSYPAAEPECMAVSATDRNDTIASYSSTGPSVEIAAPGTDITSTYAGGGYASLSGTSMACPHVSGAGAMLMTNGFTNAEARQRLKYTAENIGLSSNEGGAGLLDVAAALGV